MSSTPPSDEDYEPTSMRDFDDHAQLQNVLDQQQSMNQPRDSLMPKSSVSGSNDDEEKIDLQKLSL